MIKINNKIFSIIALFLAILLLIIIYTKRGHSYAVDLYKTEQGWGYDVLIDDKIYIHQPFMPVVEGQIPFENKKSARKIGRLVVKKIRKHKSPALSREELESVIGD